MEFVDPVLPTDSEELLDLETGLKKSSGWKPKQEHVLVWRSAIQEQNKEEYENERDREWKQRGD